jgi:hypothetical protein
MSSFALGDKVLFECSPAIQPTASLTTFRSVDDVVPLEVCQIRSPFALSDGVSTFISARRH